jgi:hypothetical protein
MKTPTRNPAPWVPRDLIEFLLSAQLAPRGSRAPRPSQDCEIRSGPRRATNLGGVRIPPLAVGPIVVDGSKSGWSDRALAAQAGMRWRTPTSTPTLPMQQAARGALARSTCRVTLAAGVGPWRVFRGMPGRRSRALQVSNQKHRYPGQRPVLMAPTAADVRWRAPVGRQDTMLRPSSRARAVQGLPGESGQGFSNKVQQGPIRTEQGRTRLRHKELKGSPPCPRSAHRV